MTPQKRLRVGTLAILVIGFASADANRDILVRSDPYGGPHEMCRDARRRSFGEKTERVMGIPPDLTRLRREKTPAPPAPPAAAVKNRDGYDGPSSGYDSSRSGYDGPRGGHDKSKDGYDGPEAGYDGPDPAYGRVNPSAPVRR